MNKAHSEWRQFLIYCSTDFGSTSYSAWKNSIKFVEAPKRTGIYRWYGEFIRNILKKSKAILDDYYLIYYYFIVSNAVVTAKSIDIMYQLSVCTEKNYSFSNYHTTKNSHLQMCYVGVEIQFLYTKKRIFPVAFSTVPWWTYTSSTTQIRVCFCWRDCIVFIRVHLSCRAYLWHLIREQDKYLPCCLYAYEYIFCKLIIYLLCRVCTVQFRVIDRQR